MRITNKHLELQIERLNQVTNAPENPWTRADGKLTANIGSHYLSQSDGGVCVHRMMNTGGGVDTPVFYGHTPKRELFDRLVSYIAGIETGKQSRKN